MKETGEETNGDKERERGSLRRDIMRLEGGQWRS